MGQDDTHAPSRPVDHAEHDADIASEWGRVRARLQVDVGEVEYRSWLRQMTLAGIDGDEVTLHLPTRFLRDWVRSHYAARIDALWRAESGRVRRVDIRVGHGGNGLAESLSAPPQPPPVERRESAGPVARGARAVRSDDLTAPLEPRFTFDTFVIGRPNEFAHACARRVAENPAHPGFNPLFLYGGVGLGKTHLMHAIGNELGRSRGHMTVGYMSAEKFLYRFIAAIRAQSTIDFKDQLRSLDVLMIDDLQFLIGKENTQEEFFHTFNALVDARKQIVVSADKSPNELSALDDRLRTRLGCGIVADLHATTYEFRVSIIEEKAARAGVDVPRKVMEFLAQRIATNVRELEGALNRLIAHANLFDRPITVETAQEVLHDVLRTHDRRVTIEEIQRRVAERYNMRIADMTSERRERAVARPRQVAMYLAKHLTTRSLPEIGRKFGNRDHTTVMHAVARVAELMTQDPLFGEDVQQLRRLLAGE